MTNQKNEVATQAHIQQSESAALISMIERAARDPQIDITKMERLFEMHQAADTRRAEREYNAAMAAAQGELVPIAKKMTNTQTRSMYADLAAICEGAMPIINRHGFGLSFSEFKSTEPGCLGVLCKVTHASGYSERHEFNIPIDGTGMKGTVNKTGTQAYGSTFSYGRRYATCGVFNIATKNDNDGNASQLAQNTVSEGQVGALNQLMEETGTEPAKLLSVAKANSIAEILASDYPRLERLLLLKRVEMLKPKAGAAA